MKSKKVRFKACMSCKHIVDQSIKKCPICGSTSFTNKWRGELIIFNLSSDLARSLNIPKEGRYAIQLL